MNNQNQQDQPNDFVKKFKEIFDNPQTRAILNDQRLLKLAEYEVANGFRNMNFPPEEVQRRFSYFKTRVLNGGQTIKDLEDDIYSAYGVQEGDGNSTTSRKSPKRFCIDDIKVADIPENSPLNH